MKNIFFLILFILTSQVFAQITGKSKSGRLFSKKHIPIKVDYNLPEITINTPSIHNNESIEHDENIIEISGIIKDDYGIKRATINNTNLPLLSSGEFNIEKVLVEGINNFIISTENIKNKSSEKQFSIDYKPIVYKKPEIVIYEPVLPSNNEIHVSTNSVNIKGMVKDLYGIASLTINNALIKTNTLGEFTVNIPLREGRNIIALFATNVQNQLIEKKILVFSKQVQSKPTISIIEPALPSTNKIFHNESIIVVRGKIIDQVAVRSIKINNQTAAIMGDNEFFANVKLDDGINNILIETININGISTKKSFKIITPIDDKGPIISIIEPAVSRGLKIVRKSDVIIVKGKITDKNGISEVTVNNRRVNLLPNNEFNTKLYLGVGKNEIIVKAIDYKYNVSIDTFTVIRKLEEVIKAGKYIALIIGINDYDGYWSPLKNAVNDATAIADVLTEKYRFDDVHRLFNVSATRKNIIQKFEWLTNNVKPDDNVLIFYAGHGQFKRTLNKGYWVPVDAESNSTAGYISNNDIKTFLGGIPSKHTLLITDACFAGDIFRGRNTESVVFNPNNMEKYYREVHRKTSRLALTSGSLEQVADAGKDNHSVFTYYLLRALKENKNKYIDATQLFNEFRMAVVNNSEQTPQLQVVRDANDEGGQFIFIKK
ncbi:MAG: caspase family protein [Ignavibacteriae bacterium]|nr:caspase family protein [Ignavibacteriota bacterium]